MRASGGKGARSGGAIAGNISGSAGCLGEEVEVGFGNVLVDRHEADQESSSEIMSLGMHCLNYLPTCTFLTCTQAKVTCKAI